MTVSRMAFQVMSSMLIDGEFIGVLVIWATGDEVAVTGGEAVMDEELPNVAVLIEISPKSLP